MLHSLRPVKTSLRVSLSDVIAIIIPVIGSRLTVINIVKRVVENRAPSFVCSGGPERIVWKQSLKPAGLDRFNALIHVNGTIKPGS